MAPQDEDTLDPLYQLVRHGVAAGVPEILIADPGRPPFDELCTRCVQPGDAEVLPWTMTSPVAESGRASIMVSVTPFCFWTTQKHLTIERTIGSRT
jgi:hypothetical protein